MSAHASVTLTPASYYVACTGDDAKRVYIAIKDTGATSVTRSNGYTTYSVDKITVDYRTNDPLEPTDPCYKHPVYSINLTQGNQGIGFAVPAQGCPTQTVAEELTTALESIGPDKVVDAAMGGERAFTVSSFAVSYNPNAQGEYQYYCGGLLGN